MADGYVTQQFCQHFMSGRHIIDGYVALGSDASVDSTNTTFWGPAVIAKSATGKYTITLGVGFQKAVVSVSRGAEGNAVVLPKVGVISTANKTIAIHTVDDDSGADTDTAVAMQLHIQIVLDRSFA